jgi:hypothetical protein
MGKVKTNSVGDRGADDIKIRPTARHAEHHGRPAVLSERARRSARRPAFISIKKFSSSAPPHLITERQLARPIDDHQVAALCQAVIRPNSGVQQCSAWNPGPSDDHGDRCDLGRTI